MSERGAFDIPAALDNGMWEAFSEFACACTPSQGESYARAIESGGEDKPRTKPSLQNARPAFSTGSQKPPIIASSRSAVTPRLGKSLDGKELLSASSRPASGT
jgi:hypothetical protein